MELFDVIFLASRSNIDDAIDINVDIFSGLKAFLLQNLHVYVTRML